MIVTIADISLHFGIDVRLITNFLNCKDAPKVACLVKNRSGKPGAKGFEKEEVFAYIQRSIEKRNDLIDVKDITPNLCTKKQVADRLGKSVPTVKWIFSRDGAPNRKCCVMIKNSITNLYDINEVLEFYNSRKHLYQIKTDHDIFENTPPGHPFEESAMLKMALDFYRSISSVRFNYGL